MKMLPEMTEFIMKTGGKSLISRIYGTYMVEYPGMSKIFLTLQKNNIRMSPGNLLASKFDLKGSRFRRMELAPQELFTAQMKVLNKPGNRFERDFLRTDEGTIAKKCLEKEQ